jgi:hypothetical protein
MLDAYCWWRWALTLLLLCGAALATRETPINRVHVVFSWYALAAQRSASLTPCLFLFCSHLDVGYAKLIADIVNEWFDSYFPAAIATAQAMRTLYPEPTGETRPPVPSAVCLV